MQLTSTDWIVIALYFGFNLLIGLYFRKRATKSVSDFFLSGRNASWWLVGTSMVATTFAADTPLVVTGLVARYGIAGNWLWWSMAFSGMLTVFFYARLWRRAGVLTDVEFAEIRYSGKPATFLRGFRAIYLGLPVNLIIMGWVNLAIVKIMILVLGVSKVEALAIALGIMAITASISTLSGLWGVLWTDLFQFVLKMSMVILLAVFAVEASGGLSSLKAGLVSVEQSRHSTGSVLSFLPDLHSTWMPFITFFVYIAVNWWASWYPGAEPGGGGGGAGGGSGGEGGMSPSEYSPRRTRSIRSWPRFGSTSRITRCAPGPGSSWRSWRWSASRTIRRSPPTPKQDISGSSSATSRSHCGGSCLPRSRQPTCRRSERSSTGARATWSTTSTGVSWRKTRPRSIT